MRPTPDAVALLALAGVAGALVAWVPGRPFVVFAGIIAAAAGMCLASPNRRLVGAVAVTELSFGWLALAAPIAQYLLSIGLGISATTLFALRSMDVLRCVPGMLLLTALAVLPLVAISRLSPGRGARWLAVGTAVLFAALTIGVLLTVALDLQPEVERCP